MKVKPIILCGGAGTRLFPSSYKIHPKQFIDFGGWNLFQKTLERIKSPIYDYPVISSNEKYEKIIKSIYNSHLFPWKLSYHHQVSFANGISAFPKYV